MNIVGRITKLVEDVLNESKLSNIKILCTDKDDYSQGFNLFLFHGNEDNMAVDIKLTYKAFKVCSRNLIFSLNNPDTLLKDKIKELLNIELLNRFISIINKIDISKLEFAKFSRTTMGNSTKIHFDFQYEAYMTANRKIEVKDGKLVIYGVIFAGYSDYCLGSIPEDALVYQNELIEFLSSENVQLFLSHYKCMMKYRGIRYLIFEPFSNDLLVVNLSTCRLEQGSKKQKIVSKYELQNLCI